VHISETKVESSKTIVMPAVMTGATAPEEEIANMKFILEKLTKENEDKEARTKLKKKRLLS